MITRKSVNVTLKNEIRQKGWSQRAIASALGITQTHLNLVLNGKRQSRRLLATLERLPVRPSSSTAA